MSVNIWAVLASAVASMVVGSIWYGPLFGKRYMAAMGMEAWSPEKKAAMKKKMGMMYALQFAASLVMFYTLAGIIVGFGHTTLGGGLTSAFFVWLGFVVPLKLGDTLWGGKMTLFWLSIFGNLLSMLVTGAIIGVWR